MVRAGLCARAGGGLKEMRRLCQKMTLFGAVGPDPPEMRAQSPVPVGTSHSQLLVCPPTQVDSVGQMSFERHLAASSADGFPISSLPHERCPEYGHSTLHRDLQGLGIPLGQKEKGEERNTHKRRAVCFATFHSHSQPGGRGGGETCRIALDA